MYYGGKHSMALVLIIEDSELQAVIVQRALEREGHEVAVVLESSKIFATIEQLQPELIITDLDMPHITGQEVIEFVKQNATLKHIPLVVFTAVNLIEYQQAAWDAGCDAFLVKPMGIPEFRRTINQFLKDYYGE